MHQEHEASGPDGLRLMHHACEHSLGWAVLFQSHPGCAQIVFDYHLMFGLKYCTVFAWNSPGERFLLLRSNWWD